MKIIGVLIGIMLLLAGCEDDRRDTDPSADSPAVRERRRGAEDAAAARDVRGYFLVVDESGLPLDDVLISWEYKRYTGSGSPDRVRGDHPNRTGELFVIGDGLETNISRPVRIHSYDGSILLFRFRKEGYAESFHEYHVPVRTDGSTGGTVSFYQRVRMRRLGVDVRLQSGMSD